MTTPTTAPLAPGVHTAHIGGLAVRYHVHGQGPVCLAHPGGPGFTWDYLRAPAVEQHLTMVYVEPIGTGGSGRLPGHPHGYTRARYSAALDGLLDHLGCGPVHLLGHSHGGFVAQHYALRHPDRLAGLILYESAPAIGHDHFTEADRNLRARFSGHHDPHSADILDAWTRVPTISDDDAFTTTARRLLPAYLADHPARAAEFDALRKAITGTYISGLDTDLRPEVIDDRDRLGDLTLPVLIVVGAHDFICGPHWANALHTLLPHADLVTLRHSGHFGHLEEPDAFAGAVTAFAHTAAP
ncbi:alpha/beta fold hydrolase [Actinomadura decatromicini]|uniref:Alpha/beta hydrolase n=1 Tax=Actinomadura decatromicini TaxID=2604572 RepID=A0A5D3FY69_9ACTN|nr:alpha/beta hydrolase [Actinomadura decatromicini]TYK53028.1 alpha/beta hydrolase [Actinomadura decatromicini]